MKTKFILCISFLVCIYASTRGQISPNFIFNNRDDIFPNQYDSGIKPYYWNNGILYLGFCIDTAFTHRGMTLTFYDTLGNQQWNHIIFFPQYKMIQCNDVVALSNSCFYIAGVVWKDTITQYDRFIAKFDMNGDSIFYKFYSDSANSWAMNIIEFAPDTLLLLSATQTKVNDDSSNIVLSKIDTLANIIADSIGTKTSRVGYQVLKDNNNRIYVGDVYIEFFWASWSQTWEYHSKVAIDVYDYSLKHLATWYPSTTLNERFDYLNLWNNHLYVTSSVTAYDSVGHYFWQCQVGKVNTNSGSYSQYKNFGTMLDVSSEGYPAVLNSNCLIIPFNAYADSLWLFVDSNLNVLCEAKIKYPNIQAMWYSEWFNQIIVLPNKKVTGTGILRADSIHSQDHWNFLTENMEDFLNANCLIGITEHNNSNFAFTVYPNPSTDFFTVTIDRNIKGELNLYNTLGEIIYTTPFNGNKKVLNFNLSPGIFLLQVTDGTESLIKKIIKE